jgi:hypothetical protein
MAASTGLTRATASLTQLNWQDPRRFEAATLVEIAEIGQQQAKTNDILLFMAEVACDNNRLMQGIRSAMDSLALTDQRERTLKELLHQMIKLLKADKKAAVDSVELAFRARLFLHTLTQHALGTADLADLSDKNIFEKLVARAKKCTEGEAHRKLVEFETVYAMYGVAQQEDPADRFAIPEPPSEPVFSPPPEPEIAPLPDDKPEETVDAELDNNKGCAYAGIAVSIGMLLLCYFMYSDKAGSKGGAILWTCISVAGLVFAFRSLLKTRAVLHDPVKYAEAKKTHQLRLDEWREAEAHWKAEKERVMTEHREEVRKAEAVFAKAKEAHAGAVMAHEKQVAHREEQVNIARQRHQSLLDQMRSQINAFLEEHSGLQEFVPKVSRAYGKCQLSDLSSIRINPEAS